MYKNTETGATVSAEQMKAWADANNMSVSEYAALAGYTQVSGPDFQNGVTDADVIVTPKKTTSKAIDEEISELESQWETFSSDLAEKQKRGERYSIRGAQRKGAQLKQQLRAAQEKRFAPPEGPSFENSYSLVNETEAYVEAILEENLPIQIAQTDIRNAVAYIDPITKEEKYINLKPATYEDRLKTAAQLDELKASFKKLSKEEYTAQITDTFVDRLEQGFEDQDIDELNFGLEGTGYKIKANYESGGYTPYGPTPTVFSGFNIYKDGEAVGSGLNRNELANYFNKNLTEEDEKKLTSNSYKAYQEFEKKVVKAREKETKKINETDLTKDYLLSGSFSALLEMNLINSGDFTEEEAEQVKNYIEGRKDTRKKIEGGRRTRYASFAPEEYIAYKTDLSGLPDDIKAKLDPNLIKSVFSAGYNRYKDVELGNRMTTINEALMKESGKQNLLKLASRYKVAEKKEYKEKKKEFVNQLQKNQEQIASMVTTRMDEISKLSPKTGFEIKNINGNYVFTATGSKEKLSEKEQEAQKLAMAEFYKLQNSFNIAQADYNEDVYRYIQDTKEFEEKEKGVEVTPEELFNLSMKEYDTGALLRKDFNDAVAGILLAVPTVFGGSEYAKQEQARLQRKNEAFETMLTYDQAVEQGRKGLFSLRTLSQQAPNIILAVTTSGAGTAMNLGKIGTQLAVGSQFGVSSGAQKYRDLLLQQDLAETAKNQVELNKNAYDMGFIDYNTYALNALDLNKTIAQGDLTDGQILGSAWATGFIEGAVTSFLGTAPNSLKAIKDFSKSGINISNFYYKTNLGRLGMTGLELGKRLAGEIAEEEIIYFGDTMLSEGLILGRDMDFSQWDDTAVSALITSGAMSTPGVAYSALMTNAATNDFIKNISDSNQNIQELSVSINELTNQKDKDLLIAELANQMEKQSLVVNGLEVDAIALGGKNQEKLLGLAALENELMQEAGVKPGSTQAAAEQQIENYKNKLKSEGKDQEAENFDIRRNTIKKQQDQVKKDVNYDRVENSLGDSGKRIKKKLETTDTNKANEYRSLNKKDKLAFIINEIRNEQRLSHIRDAKANPEIVKRVEALKDTKGKPLSKTAKDKVYAAEGANAQFYRGRAITLNKRATVSSEIVDTADLKIIQVSNKEEAQKLLEDEDLSEDEKNEIYKALENPDSNGYVYDGKYLTFNEERARAAVADGNILAATAVVHEVAHVKNDRVFDTPEKQKQYADNLHARLSQPDLAGIDQQVNDILQKRPDLTEDTGKAWEDTSAEYKDEYTVVTQEILYAFNPELKLEAKRSKESFFKGINIDTPDGALNYLLNRNADFRDGKVGKRIRKKVKKGPKISDLKKGKASYSTPDTFKASDRADLFTKTNNTFNEAAELYGLDLRLDEEGKPNFTKEQWDAVDDNTKLGIGFMIGEKWQSYIAYLMRARDQVPGYAEFAPQIIDRTATGVQKGDDGIPFLIKTYDPSKGAKLTSHIYGQASRRLQGVINKTEGFGEIAVEAAPSEPGRRELVSKERAEAEIEKAERKAKEVKKEFPKITDEVIVLDDDGKAVSIGEKVEDEVKRNVKVAFATTKFTAPIGSKKFRTELSKAMRAKLGNLFKSIMDRGVNFDNTKKVGNKEKRANYDSFVDANFENVYSIMPKSTISDRFPFLMEEITNEDGTPYYMSVPEVEAYNDAIDRGEIRGKRIANKYANNRAFKKRDYDAQVKKEGTEYLKASDKATNVRNARKASFADVIAEEAAFDVLPDVLRENDLAKESEVVEIEKQIGRGKFSVGRMDSASRFKFDLNKDLFFERVMNLNNLSKGNIKKVFLSTYSSLDFDPEIIDGVAEQFANRLKPVSKAEESVPVPVFKEILINISNQADEALALQKLVGASKAISVLSNDEDTIMLSRGGVIENSQEMVNELGMEGFQLLWTFGKPTYSASGVIGAGLVVENGRLVKTSRSRGGIDLFSGKNDLENNLLKAIKLPDGKKIKTIETNKITLESGEVITRKYKLPPAKVQIGMLKDDYKSNPDDIKAARVFVTKFFENLNKQDIDPDAKALMIATFNDGTNNALRAAAPVWGKSKIMPYTDLNRIKKIRDGKVVRDKKGNIVFETPYRFEHAIPARVVLAYLYDYHVNGNKEVNVGALWNDYRVTIIPTAEMDSVLDDTGFSSITTSNYVPGETAWHNRYYNLFTRGRMPYAMVSYDGKETVGESYEQYFNEKGTNPLIKADATQETEEKRTVDKAMANARKGKYSITPKGISVYDFDDTLAFSKSQVIVTKDGKTYKITPAEFAKQGETLAAEGAKFDFSEFNKVVKGTPGPLAPRLKKAIEKFGNKNIFVLTARPAESATAIYEFLKGIGLEIPLENITGLANGAPAAKAAWMIGKVADGYNDFYFVDDHLGNVKAVNEALEAVGVSKKVQQAKGKFSLNTKQDLRWKPDEDGVLGTDFKVANKNYKITLEETAFMEFDTDKTYQDIEVIAEELNIIEDKDGDPIESSERFFHLEFGDIKLGQGITGAGNAAQVFSIVINGVADYINKNKNIEGVIFTAKEASRIRLYKTLSRVLADQINGGFSFRNNTFIVSEKPVGFSNISNKPKEIQNVLNTFDVKGKVQQARIKHSISLDVDFNKMIERQKGVEDFKEFSKAVARRRGKTKGRFKFFIPPSAEDFRGLTQYVFAGKGKQGEADQAFFEQNLMDPYFKGVAEMERARQTIKNDTKALNKMFKPVRKKINKLVPDGDYTYDAAIRVYLWNKAGYEIPGISKRDQAKLVKLIQNDAELSAYADGLLAVSKRDKWIEPGEFWDTQTTLSDLNNLTEKINRKEYIAEFIENADIIFSEKNLNKIEAVYGTNLREAIEDALYAMKNGTNRSSGSNKITNAWNNWVNNSVGTIMFFNRRSALLQTISSINFINWSDNNPLKAGLAFANQPQYWKDFATIFNSDKLKQRRGGLKSDVQEQEIANAAKNTKDKAGAVISYLLKIGFTPTQLADSFAIAAGGATMYRNRINTYKKQGLDQKEAEAKAWQDFSKLSDEAQQSGDPALVSQQQRSTAGRLILSFQNTPMQYTRLMKKAAQDLINGRGDAKTHISKIVYYGAVQNIIFSALQNAAFALIPGFDDEDEDDEKRQEAQDKKAARMINGMTDSILRGTGIYGAVVATIKNTILKFLEQEEKGYRADHAYTIIEAANLAPPIGSKARKLYSAIQTNKFDKDVIKKHPWDVTIDGKFNLSPTYSIIGNVSSAVFNLPLDRALMEAQAVSEALDSRNTEFQRLALALGWRTWDVNAKNEEFDLIKTEAKAVRKKEGIEKAKKTRREKTLAKKELISKTISKFTDKDWDEYNRTPKKEKLEYIKKKAKEYNIE